MNVKIIKFMAVACFTLFTYSAVAKEYCYVDSGKKKCVYIGQGTSGGGCGTNSDCTGGNNSEIRWIPDYLRQAPRTKEADVLLNLYKLHETSRIQQLDKMLIDQFSNQELRN